MHAHHIDDPARWELHNPTDVGYLTGMTERTTLYQLVEQFGLGPTAARIYVRLAKAQGPTLIRDGVLLIPPH